LPPNRTITRPADTTAGSAPGLRAGAEYRQDLDELRGLAILLVPEAAAYLCSPAARYVSGVVLDVDGGLGSGSATTPCDHAEILNHSRVGKWMSYRTRIAD
jgi:NAD(P)-dependent dehydrogenase (short-subunit alcohol dehydrogenase family)